MGQFTINGKSVEFNENETILIAARRAGINIPYFCWHPLLSVSANCRMCLVKIEGVQKLLPSCEVKAKEGMKVYTEVDEVKEARRATMEFLLANHPVDCPICDQAGECRLQDYYMLYDKQPSRFTSFKDKVKKEKRKIWGQNVIYDAERCILCTRCVRFYNEILNDNTLSVMERSDSSYIGINEEKPLDNNYSLMGVYLCPTGALTNRNIRFNFRVWFLNSTQSFCPGCASLCPVFIDHYKERIYRLRPISDDALLCDSGILFYLNTHNNRIKSPVLLNKAVSLKKAVDKAADILSRNSSENIAVVLNSERSCEENYVLYYFITEYFRNNNFYVAHRKTQQGDKIIKSDELSLNKEGIKLVTKNLKLKILNELCDDINKINTVIMLGDDICLTDEQAEKLKQVKFIIYFGSILNSSSQLAHLLLPLPYFHEKDGTFIRQKDNELIELKKAQQPIENAEPIWFWLDEIAKRNDIMFTGKDYNYWNSEVKVLYQKYNREISKGK